MDITLFEYKNCSTCQKAIKYLDGKKLQYQRIPIVDQPPTVAQLKTMLSWIKKDGGTFKQLFNTSGVLYREFKIADQIKAGMSEGEALKLLAANGKLIKRPFLMTALGGAVGFKPEIWTQLIKKS